MSYIAPTEQDFVETDINVNRIGMALAHLRAARELLKEAEAKRSVEKVRKAINSTEGARRHARLAPWRKTRQASQVRAVG